MSSDQDVVEMGDHELVVWRVLELGPGAHYAAVDGPLVFYRGQLSGFSAAGDTQGSVARSRVLREPGSVSSGQGPSELCLGQMTAP